jgi:hypothetical protein
MHGHIYPDKLIWLKRQPTDPGFYWIAEYWMHPQIVKINIIPDTINKLEVILPSDNKKYPL